MRWFLVALLPFVEATAKGLRDPEFRALLFVALSLLAGGTIFYHHVEGWSLLDALYFSVVSLTTTGYGDLHPTTPLSKIFTILYLLMGIGVFVAFLSKLSTELAMRHGRRHVKRKQPEK